MGKNILVTGAAGFIGSHLVDRLLSEGGWRVTAVDNFNDFYDPKIKHANIADHLNNENYKLIEADICSEDAMNDAFADGDLDVVVHLAARAGVRPSIEMPREYYRTNVDGTLNLLEMCRRHNVKRFVFASSSSVYGINSQIPFSENDKIAQPISPYASTKAAGELLCHGYAHLYGINSVCLRFFTVYGARQRPDLAIHKFANLIANGKPIQMFGDGSTRRDYTYIDDIIDGVRAAIDYDKTPYEVFNLGESETTELKHLIQQLESAMDKKAVIEQLPMQPGDVPITFADISKARQMLGYDPQTKIEKGIPKFVEWFTIQK